MTSEMFVSFMFYLKKLFIIQKFQNVEEFHLGRMKLFLDNYVQSCENASILIGQVSRFIDLMFGSINPVKNCVCICYRFLPFKAAYVL